jgi:hypothetical protein
MIYNARSAFDSKRFASTASFSTVDLASDSFCLFDFFFLESVKVGQHHLFD